MDVANFRAGRFFFQSFIDGEGSGWFFSAREGAFGPYTTKLEAQFELEMFIQRCIEENETGGRKKEHAPAAQADVVEEYIEGIVAAAKPGAEVEASPTGPSSYFSKIRSAVRDRASKYKQDM